MAGGFAAFEYEDDGYTASDLVKVRACNASGSAAADTLSALISHLGHTC
jgi:translation elongation factor EF-4